MGARLQDAVSKDRAHTATLNILTDTLPYLRTGLNPESARRTVELLLDRLDVQAVSIVDTQGVLAYVGAAADHHRAGASLRTDLTRRVLETGRTEMVTRCEDIGCSDPACPLTAAIVAPLKIRGRTIGCLKLYHSQGRTLGATELQVAKALAKLFSAQLELSELEVQAARVAQAELEALRAQISPHFLFNTLNTIASFIRTKPDVAHDMVVEFAHFFRETLKKHGEFCSLSEELDYVEKYLSFERARLGERLKVEYAIEPSSLQAIVPVLVVQPLVENAINHGLQPKQGLGEVRISAEGRGGECIITVEDNGIGIPPDKIGRVLEPGYGSGLGMGLSNVHQRLRSLYGPAYGLHIESQLGRGTRVIVRIPAVQGEHLGLGASRARTHP